MKAYARTKRQVLLHSERINEVMVTLQLAGKAKKKLYLQSM
jgi:hypothetical protein